eukprot:m.458369 g.458369  ORF g.458369 m.458369 type:complete len:365 (+) comp21478_c0_seq1:79-1173(+)
MSDQTTDVGAAGPAEATQPPSDSMRLPEIYAKAVSLTEELAKLSANSPEYKAQQAEALKLLDTAAAMIDQVRLFSGNEDFSEHSTDSLKYLLVFAIRADLLSRQYPSVDDPDRDTKRIGILSASKGMFEEYLERCGDLGLGDGKPDELAPGARPDREAKMAQLREQMDLEKKLKELAQQLADCKASKKPIDEDLERAHLLTTLQTWLAKSKGQLGSLQQELSMLEQMAAHRRANPAVGGAGADVGAQADSRTRAPAQPPTVITKEMISEMVRTGQPINRADFKLITQGYGPIGAPTMTLQELADKEVAEAMERSQRQAAAEAERAQIDPDSEEAIDLETYRLRHQDEEFRDHVRRGDGNRYNMG